MLQFLKNNLNDIVVTNNYFEICPKPVAIQTLPYQTFTLRTLSST